MIYNYFNAGNIQKKKLNVQHLNCLQIFKINF